VKSILFYSDAAEFGGHEAMTLKAVRCLCQGDRFRVSAVFYEGNHRLCSAFTEIADLTGNLTLVPLKFKSKSLQAFRSLISMRKVEQIKGVMKRINPDVVVVSQGRIEGGSLGLLAAKRAGLRTISYIPVAHALSVSGKPFGLGLREMVNRYFYRLPDKFITISESSKRMLFERGVTRTVVVVPNGIEVKVMVKPDRPAFRERHGIGPEEYVVGVIGRIDFRQKGQDFALEAASRFRHCLQGYRLVFVGEGPDEQKLRTMIVNRGLSQITDVLPWCDNPERVYAGLDMLLIPSRFEGVPLVMLEGMSYGLPIVASNSDGMAECLPQNWLFPFGDHQALLDRIVRVRNSDNKVLLDHNRARIDEEFTTAKFCANIAAAISEQPPD
jgi:glycosyltransferase involved in cell wall biosynthesis